MVRERRRPSDLPALRRPPESGPAVAELERAASVGSSLNEVKNSGVFLSSPADPARGPVSRLSQRIFVMSSPLICGLVLAAGQSSRMGRPKALLRCAPTDDTFIARIVRTVREAGVCDVVVVGRPDDEALRSHVAGLRPNVEYLENPAPMRGQLSSLITGIERAEGRGAGAVLVMPVDIPLVRAGTIARVLAAAAESRALVVRATHHGRHGHPVLFRAAVFSALRTADPAVGARAVLRSHAGDVMNVEVDDPGVLRDFDAPEDYDQTFGRFPD